MKTQCCVGSCKVTIEIVFTIQHAHLWKPVISQPFDVRCSYGPLLRDPNSISEPCCPTMLLREVSKSSNENYKLLLTFALIVGGVRVRCFGRRDFDHANNWSCKQECKQEWMGNSQLKPSLGSVSQKCWNFSGLLRVPQKFWGFSRNKPMMRILP